MELRNEFSDREASLTDTVATRYVEILDRLAGEVQTAFRALDSYETVQPAMIESAREKIRGIYAARTLRDPLFERTVFGVHLLRYDLTAAAAFDPPEGAVEFYRPRSWGFGLGCAWSGAPWFPVDGDPGVPQISVP
jgi:hypothetical protein